MCLSPSLTFSEVDYYNTKSFLILYYSFSFMIRKEFIVFLYKISLVSTNGMVYLLTTHYPLLAIGMN